MRITIKIDTRNIDEILSLKIRSLKPPKVLEGERISFEDCKKEIKKKKKNME